MGKSGLKARLAPRRQSRRHGNWTLSVAVLATLVTIGLFAIYLTLEAPEFP